jgi:hypothetical protein
MDTHKKNSNDNDFLNFDGDDALKLNFSDDSARKYRTTTRLLYDDIAARINGSGLSFFAKAVPVTVLDISSKGALVSSTTKLSLNKKITLALAFKAGNTFKINAIIIRKNGLSTNEYGIKFDNYNNELGDYLFDSIDDLIFK